MVGLAPSCVVGVFGFAICCHLSPDFIHCLSGVVLCRSIICFPYRVHDESVPSNTQSMLAVSLTISLRRLRLCNMLLSSVQFGKFAALVCAHLAFT